MNEIGSTTDLIEEILGIKVTSGHMLQGGHLFLFNRVKNDKKLIF